MDVEPIPASLAGKLAPANLVKPIESLYDERCARFGALRDAYQRRSNLNGNANLLLFLATVASVGFASLRGQSALYGISIILALGFVAALVHHGRINGQLRRYQELFNINREGKSRLRREWSELPLQSEAHGVTGGESVVGGAIGSSAAGNGAMDNAAVDRGTAADLDLLGRASLEHLLGTPKTPMGRATLRDWIVHPADPGTIRVRQSAVAELGPDIDFRDEACLRARLMGSERTDYHRFLRWAESESWTPKHVWASRYARVAPLVMITLIGGQLLGVTTFPGIIAILLANGALLLTSGRAVGDEIDRVATQQNVFEAYASIIEIFTGKSVTSQGLKDIQSRMSSTASIRSSGSKRADEQIRRLARLMPLADFRRWMFFIFIEIATLWSFHTLWLLERWKQTNGSSVRGWLTALGQAEAIVALAGLHHDHPKWAFPEIVEGGTTVVTAMDLAHPLLPPSRAVGNDIAVGPPGSFLLVTGSNMSGKSTLLRAIGVNTVLAQMGGPVCAARMALPPLALTSAMRVQDSLEQGISYFMAELRRLKAIVDQADRAGRTGNPGNPALLYLLDEILVGTNTAERQAAARHIILHLVRTGAIGAVSTHDLTLAALPEMARVSTPVHFQETFADGPDGKSMTFDYRLRPGIATSTNALKLMELVGLPVEA